MILRAGWGRRGHSCLARLGAVLMNHAAHAHVILADQILAKNIFSSIAHGVGIFLLVVLLIGMLIGLIVGFFIGKAVGRRD